MALRSARVHMNGLPRLTGTPQEVCRQCIEACWDQTNGHFRVSPGNHTMFYCRDMAWCCGPLIALGHHRRVISTLSYALRCFSEHGSVTVAISPGGCFDFPAYAVDSLPSLLRCLREAKAKGLVSAHRAFLIRETLRLEALVVEAATGLVRSDRTFSSARDHSKRRSSCYDNAMLGMLSRELDALKLPNPLKRYDYGKLLKKHFWNGAAFIDDLSANPQISADANVFPYWCGVISDRAMMRSSFKTLQELKLDRPFPLRYSNEAPAMHYADLLVPGYERDTVWPYLGFLFIRLLRSIDPAAARKHLALYTSLIRKHANFLELYTKEGEPFSTPLYVTDDSMLWASMYLELCRR